MAEEVKIRKKSRSTLPGKEADIISLVGEVVAAWDNHPNITLIWVKPEELKNATAQLADSYRIRETEKGNRAAVSHMMREVNTEINGAIPYVKNYIADMFSVREAQSHYPQIGLVKVGGVYGLPNDQNKRLLALDQMVRGIGQLGLNDRKFGLQFWEDIRKRFSEVKGKASESDSTSAEHVGIKADRKTFILEVLNSLVLAIKANYPRTWKEELRVWGFQKEKY